MKYRKKPVVIDAVQWTGTNHREMFDFLTDYQCTDQYMSEKVNPYGRPFEGTAYELGLKIMDYIENMDGEKENGWIPVSERLPEASGTYQVTCMDGRIYRSTYAKFQNKLKRWELTGARSYWKVAAWMPLPEPYKED